MKCPRYTQSLSKEALQVSPQHVLGRGPGCWKKRLANLVDFPDCADVEKFIRTTGIAGMKKVEQELEAKGWVAEVNFDEQNLRAQFQVFQEGKLEFIYEIRLRSYAMPDFACPETTSNKDADEK